MNRLPFGEEERRRLEEWSREYDPSRRTNKKGESGNLALLCRCVWQFTCACVLWWCISETACEERVACLFGDDRRPDNSVQELLLMPFLMLVSKLSFISSCWRCCSCWWWCRSCYFLCNWCWCWTCARINTSAKKINFSFPQVSRLPPQPPPDELLLDGPQRGVLRTHLQHAHVRIRRQVVQK